jgi:HAD superfamily hydrolase (TIGR01509 family)
MLQAVFWDMDGTIVDTEPYWFQAQRELASTFGMDWTEEQATLLIGKALPDSAQVMRDAGTALPIDDIVQRLTNSVLDQVKRDVFWRPGARELLAQLRGAGVPCVLVTMSRQPLAAEVVRHLPMGTFEFMITGEMVARGKPHPEPYLMAAERLGRDIDDLALDRIVAIEDSLPGIASASASGALTLGVPNMVPLPASPGITLWSTLEGRSVADLEALIPSHVPVASASR